MSRQHDAPEYLAPTRSSRPTRCRRGHARARPRTAPHLEQHRLNLCVREKIAKSKPAERGLPFSTWSLAKLADFLVAEGVVDDISVEGLRETLRAEGVSFQRIKTCMTSRDPEHLYAIADGEVKPEPGEPTVVFSMDEFGPLNLQPHPGRQWAELGGRHKDPHRGREATTAGYLHPPARSAASVRRARPGPQRHVRACEETQETRPISRILSLPAQPLPGARTHSRSCVTTSAHT
jgi:hypothetical protein